MRYVVVVQERRFEVEVVETNCGTQVRVASGEAIHARLVPHAGSLHTLEHGTRRRQLLVEADPEDGERFHVQLAGRASLPVETRDARIPAARGGSVGGKKLSRLKSAMPGLIVEVRVTPGQTVEKNQVLLILEAMKMQNEIRAEGQGKVKAIKVAPGASVAAGALLIEFE